MRKLFPTNSWLKLIVILQLLTINTLAIQSQSLKTTFIGNFKLIKTTGNLVTIRSDEAWINLNVYQDDLVRVRISKDSIIESISEAVIQTPLKSFVKVVNEPSQVSLYTEALHVVVQKFPIRILFFTLNGQMLNRDFDDLGVFWQGDEVTCTKSLFKDEKFMGLGEKGRDVNRRGNSYSNTNFESAHYVPSSDPLYSSFPVFVSVHDKLTYGVFLDNTHKTMFNMGASTNDEYYSFTATNGILDYYFFGSQGLNKIIEKYSWLTGRMSMPPLWLLGNQQSRWSYYPETSVLNVATNFRERKIPADAIYLDIDYMEHFKVFTWSPVNFPNPKETIDKLKKLNFHTITIVDPGVKVEKNYFVYEEMLRNDLFIKYPTGKIYTPTVWPGLCHFPDFTMAKTRELWGSYHSALIDKGVEGFWNDMNEPAAWGNSVPEVLQCNYDGNPTSFKKARNVFAFNMARATFEGTRKLLNGNRTFILSRSGYSGIQRYAAMWSGDTESSDDYLFMVVRQMLSMGVSGMPYMGFDTPGFSGNPSANQFLRWLAVAAYSPILRNHHCIGTNLTEPWAYGEDTESAARKIIEQRYKLIPYIYSTFYAATQTGRPICRMLPLEFTFDEKVYSRDYQHQYLFGDNIMVSPVSTDQKFAKVYFPAGTWYKIDSDVKFTGPVEAIVEAPRHSIPVFVKESGIIPMQSLIQSTNEAPSDTLELFVYYGSKSNTFNYYEDDGKTYQYETGSFYKRQISYIPENNTIEISEKIGSLSSKFKKIKFVLCYFPSIKEILLHGNKVNISELGTTKQTLVIDFKDKKFSIQLN